MEILQEVLSNHAQRDSFCRTPGQSGVKPRVGGDGLGREAVDEVGRCIPLEVPGQAYTGPQLCLMIRIAAFRPRDGRDVLTAGEWMQMRGEERIGGTQRPKARHLPVRESFKAVRFSVETIAEGLGNKQMYGPRTRFNARCAWFDRHQVVIAVVRNSRIKRDPAGQRGPVACFECRELLVLLIWISEKAHQHRQVVGPWEDFEVYAEIGIGAGGCAVGMGDRTPDGVPAARSPHHACRGLDVKSGVVVVFKSCAQAQMNSICAESDLILHKRAEQLSPAVLWSRGDSQRRRHFTRTDAVSKPPDDILSRTPHNMVLKVDVEDVLAKVVSGIAARRAIEIDLQRCLRTR